MRIYNFEAVLVLYRGAAGEVVKDVFRNDDYYAEIN